MSKVLLYSGGTDSWLIDKLYKPDRKIYVNIHGFYSQQEMARLPADVEIVDFPFLGTTEELDTNYVPLRNLYFLMIATAFGDEVCYGATLGDAGCKDKRREFIIKAQDIIDYCNTGNSFTPDRHIRINTDYIGMNKFELIDSYLQSGGTIEEFVKDSFSCYHSNDGKECYCCKQCYKKFLEAYYFGYEYPNDVKERMVKYLISDVIPLGHHEGTYFTERAGEGQYMATAINRLFMEYGLNWEIFK